MFSRNNIVFFMSDESIASLTLHFNRQNQRQYIRVEDVRPKDYVTTQDKEKTKVRIKV